MNIPTPQDLDLSRVAVVGATNSGKTTFGTALGQKLGIPFVELDALNWGPNWQQRDNETFRQLTAERTAGARWVSDGNYSRVRDLVLDRTTTIFWLNYPIYINLYRFCKRTTRRILTREVIFSGNVETIYNSILARDALLWWLFSTHKTRRQHYGELFKTGYYQNAKVIIFTQPKQADAFLNSLDHASRSIIPVK